MTPSATFEPVDILSLLSKIKLPPQDTSKVKELYHVTVVRMPFMRGEESLTASNVIMARNGRAALRQAIRKIPKGF